MLTRTMAVAALLAALAAPLAGAEEINPVLGKVGDFTIRETDLDRLIGSQPPEARKQLEARPELKAALVQELLTKKAIAQKARKEGFDKKPEFREKLALLIDEFLSREFLLNTVVAGVTVPEEDLKKFYQENEKEFSVPESVKARHIFIQVAEAAMEEARKKGLDKANTVLERLHKGEDFVKLAAELSEDEETAKKGGELATISPGKTNSGEFEKAAFALKPGETSGVVRTPYGYHIIKVDSRTERRTPSFSEVRDFIADQLKKEYEQRKVQEYVTQVVKESGLELHAERIPGAVKEAPVQKGE